MSKAWKTILILVSIIIIIILIGLYRSYIDGISPIEGFDLVAGTVISELWEFISNPAVFTPLAIIVFLIYTRENWIPLLSRAEEVKLPGGVSAKFYNNVREKISKGKKGGQAPITDEETLKVIVGNLTDEFVRFLLVYSNSTYELVDFLNIISQMLFKFPEGVKFAASEVGRCAIEIFPFAFGAGYLSSLQNLQGILFNIQFPEEGQNNIQLKLLPKVPELLRARLEQIDEL